MKKTLGSLSVALVLAGSLAAPVTMADPGKGSANDDAGFPPPFNGLRVVEFCKLADAIGLLDVLNVKNVGQCIKLYRADDSAN